MHWTKFIFPEDYDWHPNALFLIRGQSVHVDVGLHIEELQAEIIPGDVELELDEDILADLIDVQDGDEVHLDLNTHLDQVPIIIDHEGSVVGHIVFRSDHQPAVGLITEVIAVGKLVTALLHPDTLAITVTRELVPGADCHQSIKWPQRVPVTNILVECPHHGSGAHGVDGSSSCPIDSIVWIIGQHPFLMSLSLLVISSNMRDT